MNIRDLPIYKKHYDANEPEDHTRITIECCIEILSELINQTDGFYTVTGSATIGVDAAHIITKRNELKSQLKLI